MQKDRRFKKSIQDRHPYCRSVDRCHESTFTRASFQSASTRSAPNSRRKRIHTFHAMRSHRVRTWREKILACKGFERVSIERSSFHFPLISGSRGLRPFERRLKPNTNAVSVGLARYAIRRESSREIGPTNCLARCDQRSDSRFLLFAEPKKRRFHPLRGLRKIFRRKSRGAADARLVASHVDRDAELARIPREDITDRHPAGRPEEARSRSASELLTDSCDRER